MSVLDRFRVDGKIALVTGGSRGLGRSIACALAEAGADLIITGRDQEALDRTADVIRGQGRDVSTLAVDMGVAEQCEAAFEECARERGPIDILVNNIGGRRTSVAVQEQSLQSWNEILSLNLTSCFLGLRIVGGAMIDRGQGGRIINIASMNALIANRGIGGRSYEAAKAGVVQLTRAAAADWAPHRVTVNAICPGLFMTQPNKAWQVSKPAAIEALISGIPMGRAGDPEEIGPLAVFLASPASSYITGAVHVIDGGYTLW